MNSKRKDIISVIYWTIAWIFIFDILIYIFFSFKNPESKLYKRIYNFQSIETKLKRQIADNAEIIHTGWLDPLNIDIVPDGLEINGKQHGKIVASFYGQSFSNQIAIMLQKINPGIVIRMIAGPAAPLNHSFSAFRVDQNKKNSDFCIIGILADSVYAINSMTGSTWNFLYPLPYTYPRYYEEENDSLNKKTPLIVSLDHYRHIAKDPDLWNNFINQLYEDDEHYDTFLFRSFLDNSAFFGQIRKGWAQHVSDKLKNEVYKENGFIPNSPVVRVMEHLVIEFAKDVRKGGQIPIVLLIETQGYKDHLYTILEPTLSKNSIPFLATHKIVSPDNNKNFIPDGHFTEEAFNKIAVELNSLMKELIKYKSKTNESDSNDL